MGLVIVMKATALISLLYLGFVPCYQSLKHAVSQSDSDSAFAAEDFNLLEQEVSADQRFWMSEWEALEGDLLRLEHLAQSTDYVSEMSVLQVTAKPQIKEMDMHAAANATDRQLHAQKAKKGNGATSIDLGKLMKSVMSATSKSSANNPMKAVALVPALDMLKAMYADGKDRITKLNERETKYKKQFEERQKTHNAQMAKIEHKKNNTRLSADFLKNMTKEEDRLFSYWQRVRERQHRQYHTSLKIQHSMMQRVKTMIDMYEKTIKGNEEQKAKVRQELQSVTGGGMPEVVLMQETRKEVIHFCKDALEEVHMARQEFVGQ